MHCKVLQYNEIYNILHKEKVQICSFLSQFFFPGYLLLWYLSNITFSNFAQLTNTCIFLSTSSSWYFPGYDIDADSLKGNI